MFLTSYRDLMYYCVFAVDLVGWIGHQLTKLRETWQVNDLWFRSQFHPLTSPGNNLFSHYIKTYVIIKILGKYKNSLRPLECIFHLWGHYSKCGCWITWNFIFYSNVLFIAWKIIILSIFSTNVYQLDCHFNCSTTFDELWLLLCSVTIIRPYV